MTAFDVCVVGAGLVGLATARALLTARPRARVVVIDKEMRIAAHQSSHNSGVVHSGVFYAPGSLKAQLCLEGRRALLQYAEERGVAHEICGKLIVAARPDEVPGLREIHRRGVESSIPDLRLMGSAELRDIEPHARGVAALAVPSTAIIDFGRVAEFLAGDVREMGGEVRLGAELRGWAGNQPAQRLTTTDGDLEARNLINCAGLWSHDVLRLTTRPDQGSVRQRIIPFRGDYYILRPSALHLVRSLIYPVPDARYPFLGVHFTRQTDGQVWVGPNAVLAFARDGYKRTNVNLGEVLEIVRFRGFRRFAKRHWRSGVAEMWRDVSTRAFLASAQTYVPDLLPDHLARGPSGVRAQALDDDGVLADDFSLVAAPGMLHVLNAPSPAATASLSIGRLLAERACSIMRLPT